MANRDVPPWVSVAHGSAPILLLAPHGGRRDNVRVPGRHKVNDLLTAEVTRELAAGCGASTIVNERLDRNQLDLNRLSQVRRDARWLIDLLAEMLGAMVSESGHATVLVMHGWNVTQTACDVGIGMREHESGLVSVRSNTTTVSGAFVATHVRPLQEVRGLRGYRRDHRESLSCGSSEQSVADFPSGGISRTGASCPVAALCRAATSRRLSSSWRFRCAGPVRVAVGFAMLTAVFEPRGLATRLWFAYDRRRRAAVFERASDASSGSAVHCG